MPKKVKFSKTDLSSPTFLNGIKKLIDTAGKSGVKKIEISKYKIKIDFVKKSKIFEWLEQHKIVALFILFGILCVGVLIGKHKPKLGDFINKAYLKLFENLL